MGSASFRKPWRRFLFAGFIGCFLNLAAPFVGSKSTGQTLTARAAESGVDDIQKMRAKEIKEELVNQGIDVSDIFDKEGLVERLYQLRNGLIEPEPVPLKPEPEPVRVKPEPEPVPVKPEPEPVKTQEVKRIDKSEFIAKCKAMRVKELRTELGQRGLSWADALDKDELVERLAGVLAKEAAFCNSGRLKPGIVSKITGKELAEELSDSTTPLLLDVYATWCGPCKVMESQLAAAAQKLGSKIRIAKMDSDEESDTSTNLGVGALPTLILFDRSGKQVQRFEGAMMESQIIEMVQAAKL